MPSPISIRERIVRQWKTNIAAITDVTIGTVHRWDARVDHQAYQPADLWVIVDAVAYKPEEQLAWLEQSIDLCVRAYVPAPDNGTLTTAIVADRWMAAIEKVLLSDRFTTETATGVKLSYDMQIDSAEIAELQDGVTHVAVTTKVFFRTSRTTPYSSGAIAETQE